MLLLLGLVGLCLAPSTGDHRLTSAPRLCSNNHIRLKSWSLTTVRQVRSCKRKTWTSLQILLSDGCSYCLLLSISLWWCPCNQPYQHVFSVSMLLSHTDCWLILWTPWVTSFLTEKQQYYYYTCTNYFLTCLQCLLSAKWYNRVSSVVFCSLRGMWRDCFIVLLQILTTAPKVNKAFLKLKLYICE